MTVRLLPYWCDVIVPDLSGLAACWWCRTATPCGRWSSTWKAISDEASSGLEMPNAIPVNYRFEAGHAIRLTYLTQPSFNMDFSQCEA